MNNPPPGGGAPRQLTDQERRRLLAAEQAAHLGTIDAGFPHITPIWFLWDGDAFIMSSLPHRPHVRRLEANPAACICIDVEERERDDGERPNRQVRGVGTATLAVDDDGEWTRRITAKYVHGPALETRANLRASRPRVVIRLAPVHRCYRECLGVSAFQFGEPRDTRPPVGISGRPQRLSGSACEERSVSLAAVR